MEHLIVECSMSKCNIRCTTLKKIFHRPHPLTPHYLQEESFVNGRVKLQHSNLQPASQHKCMRASSQHAHSCWSLHAYCRRGVVLSIPVCALLVLYPCCHASVGAVMGRDQLRCHLWYTCVVNDCEHEREHNYEHGKCLIVCMKLYIIVCILMCMVVGACS